MRHRPTLGEIFISQETKLIISQAYNLIDADVITLMSDAELEKYIPKFGDRIALRSFLKTSSSAGKEKEKRGLLDKLRRKLQNYTETDEKESNSSLKKTKCMGSNASKERIRIELGWMHFNEKAGYTQVRTKHGGGTRSLKMEKTAKKREIMKEAKSIFFPGGKSTKGEISNMKCELTDFKLDCVDEGISIAEIINKTKMYKVRFYLTTKQETEDSDELPDTTTKPTEIHQNAVAETTEHIATEQYAIAENTVNIGTQPNVISQNDQNPENSDFLVFDNEETSFADLLAINTAPKPITVDMNSILAADALARALNESEVQFGPGPDRTLDDTIPYEYNEQGVQTLTVHRGHVLNDLVLAATRKNFRTNVKYKIKMIGSNGIEEAAEDNGGVMRDALTEFYESWKQEQVFPVQLAKPFMQQCLFGNMAQKCDLIAPFIHRLPRMDLTVLIEALNDFKADEGELLDLLERLKVKQITTKDNIRRILEEVAHRELVQAPMFVCDSWYNILCQLSIDYEQLDHIYENLEPTNRKVLKALK
ncbi:hypothetical protein KUTeg_023431 [Tegillarca granosa]|uniref:Uncharacterized protein n=1 Tax=Tegillarca granosa TaxID=220873 RepID=A0ABQ9E4L6_TEGGR|nr:hypothetical protein KUTeg_023431 [Tegillarca granosa]